MIRIFALFLLAALTFPAFSCGDSNKDTGSPAGNTGPLTKDRRLNVEGLKHYRQGNFQVALEKFREASQVNAKDAEYPNNMGMCHMRLGQAAKARALFAKALSLRKLPLYHFNQGTALLQLRQVPAALASFNEAVKINSKYVDAWIQVGAIHFRNKNYGEARKAWTAAAGIRDDARIQTNLGMIELREGKPGAAEKRFRGALKLNAGYALAHYNLGVVLQNRKQYSPAEKAYMAAISLNPRAYVPYYNLAVTQTALGKKLSARKSLEQFLRLVPPGMSGPIADAKQRLRALSK